MPIRINEILTDNDNDSTNLFIQLTELLQTVNPVGVFNNEEKNIFHVVYYLYDDITDELDLRCIFTLHQDNDTKELQVLDVDVTIPNEHTINLLFDEIQEDNEMANEVWNVEYDEKRTIVETVNRHLIYDELKGIRNVSLSAMPYGDPKFGKTIDEVNELFGFKPKVYKWQEALNMGTEPIRLGFAEDFIGMGTLIGKIISYKAINVLIGDSVYKGMLVNMNTGYGEMPALFPIKYEDDIKANHYVITQVELKADLCVDYPNPNELKQYETKH